MQKESSVFTPVPQSQWQLTSSTHRCVLCAKSFGLFQVAENCRGCGRVCCSSCLSDHLVLPGKPGTAAAPVCPICAKAINRTYEEAEMAIHRCQLLEEIINEQALQAEKMRSDLREQQEENKLLHHEKESLKATIVRMEIEAEVAAAKAAAAAASTATSAASVGVAASFPTTVGSPATSPARPESELTALGDGTAAEESLATLEENLTKKKRQLDIREATLKEALKKVSADAAKNADQRAALQEQERELTVLVTSKFTALFEEERQRLEDLCTDAVTDVQNQYVAWIGKQQDAILERRRRYEKLVEERQQRTAAELAEMRASRDALQRQLETQKEFMETLQREAQSTQATAAAETAQEQQEEQRKQQLEQAVAAAIQRAGKAEEELRSVQAQLESTKALYAEETRAHEAAFAAYESEHQQVQQRLEAFMDNFCAHQEGADEERAAAVSAAVEAAEQRAAERHAQELAVQQKRLETKAAADIEAAVQRIEQQHATALESANAQHKTEKEVLESAVQKLERQLQEAMKVEQQQHMQMNVSPVAEVSQLQALEETTTAAAALADLQQLHAQQKIEWEAHQAQLEAQLRNAKIQREKAQEESGAALESAAQAHAAAIAELTAKQQKERETWEKSVRQLKRAKMQQDEELQSREKTWKDEKLALQKTCKDFEARLEMRKTAAWQLQQQLRDCKQQLADVQAQHQKRTEEEEMAVLAQSRAATALQRGVAALVREFQQAQQRIVTEHTAAVAQIRSELQRTAKTVSAAAAQREKTAREVVKQLQVQITSANQRKDEIWQHLKAEEEKRSIAEAEVKKLKSSLQLLHEASEKQRQAVVALHEKYQHVADELEAVKAEKMTPTALAGASSSPQLSRKGSLAGEWRLFDVQQRWLQQKAYVEELYAMALITILQHEWSAAMDAASQRLEEEAQKQRQMRARNAEALENTTSTIREVQEDLRIRTQALVERQALVDEQERQIADKKKRVIAVCHDLCIVAQELRKKDVDYADSADVKEFVRSARIMREDV